MYLKKKCYYENILEKCMKTNLFIKKGLAIGFILLFIGVAISPSNGQNIKKPSAPKSKGNWLYVGGSGPGNFTKIQDAINNSTDGETILVYCGIYYENLLINKSGISLIGQDQHSTILDGSKKDNVILILANSIQLNGFTIQNSSDKTVGIAAQILMNPIHNIKDIHISNCTLRNNTLGVLFNNVSNSSIVDCQLENLKSQSITIRLLSENISIFNCSIHNNGEVVGGWISSGCIYIDGGNHYNCSNINISYNDIYNITGSGIEMSKSNNVTVFQNDIHENSLSGLSIGASKNCEIYYNIIFENSYDGIIAEKSNINIHSNHIYKNGLGNYFDGGIILQDCVNNQINNNIIEINNQYGYLFSSGRDTVLA